MGTEEQYTNGDMTCNGMSKVFNDPIHGHIELHPLCIKIIDTPQFQRLRNIKQLGTCYLVYPGASHNRFEHSLGVCYLAGKLLRAIKERQPDELITDKDILCVEIAGLCHDLGHGPFSHLFDQKFIPSVLPNSGWKHEKASVQMFDYMLRDNAGSLRKEFNKLMDDFRDEDLTFIKELIDVPEKLAEGRWPYQGRGKDKSFLYEVVANKTNGIDVDKWDYFARDCYMLGMKNSFDHTRCIFSARVLVADGRKQICYREKEAHDLYDMFSTRMTLHRKAYQHKTHNIIGKMMCDALVAANEYITYEGENGKQLRMSETIYDMKAYTQLTDTVLRTILLSSDERLKTSKDILHDIISRKLYKFVAQTQGKITVNGNVVDTDNMKEFILEYRNEERVKLETVAITDLEIDIVKVDYGMKTSDPIQNVRFYRKDDKNKTIIIRKSQISHILPDTFAEQYIRLYCKINTKEVIEHFREAFSAWCSKNKYPKPKGDEYDCDDQTDTATTEQ